MSEHMNYLDIGHSPGPGVLLWIHNGKVRAWETSTSCCGHSHGKYDGAGRVDIVKKIGSITFNFTISGAIAQRRRSVELVAQYTEHRKKARRIVRDVIKAFTGVKFRVFIGYGNTTVQKFWEETE